MSETRFHSLLKQKVLEAVDDRAASLASGAATDYAQYRQHVGYIMGMQDVLKICEDIEREFDR